MYTFLGWTSLALASSLDLGWLRRQEWWRCNPEVSVGNPTSSLSNKTDPLWNTSHTIGDDWTTRDHQIMRNIRSCETSDHSEPSDDPGPSDRAEYQTSRDPKRCWLQREIWILALTQAQELHAREDWPMKSTHWRRNLRTWMYCSSASSMVYIPSLSYISNKQTRTLYRIQNYLLAKNIIMEMWPHLIWFKVRSRMPLTSPHQTY